MHISGKNDNSFRNGLCGSIQFIYYTQFNSFSFLHFTEIFLFFRK